MESENFSDLNTKLFLIILRKYFRESVTREEKVYRLAQISYTRGDETNSQKKFLKYPLNKLEQHIIIFPPGLNGAVIKQAKAHCKVLAKLPSQRKAVKLFASFPL